MINMTNKKRLIEFIELVKINSLTGKENIADLLLKKLSEIGFEVTTDNAGQMAGEKQEM